MSDCHFTMINDLVEKSHLHHCPLIGLPNQPISGLISCLSVICIFISFSHLSVGDASTIIFCSPIFVMVFSNIFLREHCGLYRCNNHITILFFQTYQPRSVVQLIRKHKRSGRDRYNALRSNTAHCKHHFSI